ncbi:MULTISPECIES: hypothetical protein [Cysteiniphilum]|uniref:hypothetical protein n=2 Tax=Fastidiosibacteraceae TaxID=2056687 RepID=UPI0017875230|nr:MULTISPECIES: hypothetical protein [Cysteiniphilum]
MDDIRKILGRACVKSQTVIINTGLNYKLTGRVDGIGKRSVLIMKNGKYLSVELSKIITVEVVHNVTIESQEDLA